MTEVPEHLLRRSRERRSALGLGGGEGGAPPGEGESAAPEGASAATPVRAEAAAPAAATPAAPPAPPEPPKPPPPYVAAALTRPKVPKWAIPVLAALPLWALIYAGSLYVPSAASSDPVLSEGQEIYELQCQSCHGGEGGGGVGRPLGDGEVLLTFPDPADHIEWVELGTAAVGEGNPYGDPNRPGGQHIGGETAGGAMPGFGEQLSEEEIVAVVRYEREILAGETGSVLASAEGDGALPENEAQSEGGDTGGGGE